MSNVKDLELGLVSWLFLQIGMLRHLFGRAVIFVSLPHFITPALDLMPCVQAQGMRDGNKSIKSKKGAINSCNEHCVMRMSL